MEAYSKTFIAGLANKIEAYHKDISYNDHYWRGLSWSETIALREKLKLTDKSGSTDINAVLDWGGIRSFKGHSLFIPAIKMLNNGEKLPYKVYSNISSFSKLFAFYDPTKYFILDARVAFTLNNMILEVDPVYPGFNFPFQYRSRNVRLKAAALKIRIPRYHADLGIGYVAYNRLIQDVFEELNRNKAGIEKAEIVEMFFFKTTDMYF